MKDVTNLTNKGPNRVNDRNSASVELLADIFKEIDTEKSGTAVDRRYNISFKYTSTPMGTIIQEEESEADGCNNIDVDRSNILTRVDSTDSIEKLEIVRLIKSFEAEEQAVVDVRARRRKTIGAKRNNNSKAVKRQRVSKARKAPNRLGSAQERNESGQIQSHAMRRARKENVKMDTSKGLDDLIVSKERSLAGNRESKQTSLSKNVKVSRQIDSPKKINESKKRKASGAKQRNSTKVNQSYLPKVVNMSQESKQEKTIKLQTARPPTSTPAQHGDPRISKVLVLNKANVSKSKISDTFKSKTELKSGPSIQHLSGIQPSKLQKQRKKQAPAKSKKITAIKTKIGPHKSPLQILYFLKTSTHQFTKAEILALCSKGRDPIDLMR